MGDGGSWHEGTYQCESSSYSKGAITKLRDKNIKKNKGMIIFGLYSELDVRRNAIEMGKENLES